jgi:2-iminoacetate synthase ThiH
MAETLLYMALSLLIAAQQPNVPQSVKDQAVDVANTAIMVAMEDTTPVGGVEEVKPEESTDTPVSGKFDLKAGLEEAAESGRYNPKSGKWRYY